MKKIFYLLKFSVITAFLVALSANLMGQPNYHVKILQPNGGEKWAAGTTHLISWKDNFTGKVDIYLDSCNNSGVVKKSIPIKNNVSGSTYNWKIPSTYSGKYFKIRVQSSIDTTVSNNSNRTFSIGTFGYIKVLQPNKNGIEWALGTTHLISWNDNLSTRFNIYLVQYNNRETKIIKRYPVAKNINGSTFSWKINKDLNKESFVAGGHYKIVVYNNDSSKSDLSNNTFSITNVPKGSFIKVLQPTKKGISWAMGSTHLISWDDNLTGRVDIYLEDVSTGTNYLIKSGVKGSTYSWKIDGKDHASTGNTYSTGKQHFKIIVVSAGADPDDNTLPRGISKNPFSIYQSLRIDAYPNPTTNFVTVKVNDNNNKNYVVTLYNRFGVRQATGLINTNISKELRLSTLNLPKGIYFISVTGGPKKISKMIIVQH